HLRDQVGVRPGLDWVARRPLVQVADAADAGLVELLQAAEAGPQRRVAASRLDGVAEPGCLEQGVLLGVDADADVVAAAALVVLGVGAALAAALVAVAEAGRCAVVSGRDDALVCDEHRADVTAEAHGALAGGD